MRNVFCLSAVVAAFLLASCATVPEGPPVPVPGSLDRAMAESARDPAGAAERLVTYLGTFEDEDGKGSSLAVSLASAFESKSAEFGAKGDYANARSAAASLSRLATVFRSGEETPDPGHAAEAGLYDLEAAAAAAAGLHARAYLLRRKAALLRGQNQQGGSLVPEASPEFRASLDRALSPSVSQADFQKLLKATITISVDRGIKVEKGLGMPDRVVGSGFFIDDQGHALTNYHVVMSEVDPEYEGYSKLEVRLDGAKEERIKATVVGWDRILDLAVIKVPVRPEAWIPVTGASVSSPGDRVYALGSPVGLVSTVSAGIVSALDREILQIGTAMQIDVPVNPGNSGGPLVSESGRLSGIVFAGLPQFQGLNFAVPEPLVADALPHLLSGGERSRAWTGLAGIKKGDGLRVLYPVPGLAGWRSGIAEGDTVVSVNGVSVREPREAQAAMSTALPGELVSVEILRNGKKRTHLLKSEDRPFRPFEALAKSQSFRALLTPLLGMWLDPVNLSPFEPSFVVREVLPGSISDEAGISDGDPIILKGASYEKDFAVVLFNVFVKKKKLGFIESIIQLPASIETDSVF